MVLGPRSPQRVTDVGLKRSRVTLGVIFCVVSTTRRSSGFQTYSIRGWPQCPGANQPAWIATIRRDISPGPRPEGPQEHRV